MRLTSLAKPLLIIATAVIGVAALIAALRSP